MNSISRQMLRRIVAKYGREICGDARRCENLLRDLCGQYRPEINVLVTAIGERVPLDLLAGNRSVPLELLLTRCEKRLEEHTALTAEAARWAVESWALALDIAGESDIEARQKRADHAIPAASKPVLPGPPDSAAGRVPQASQTNRHPPPKPQLPASQPNRYPPAARPPIINIPSRSAQVGLPSINPPASPPVRTSPANLPVVAQKRSFVFRGCLLVMFLLAITSVVLFFGVHYAIEVMRETQRERNNEQPRFPVR